MPRPRRYRIQATRDALRRAGLPASLQGLVAIGADGARSAVARQCVPGADETPFVFAYHEIVRSPAGAAPSAP